MRKEAYCRSLSQRDVPSSYLQSNRVIGTMHSVSYLYWSNWRCAILRLAAIVAKSFVCFGELLHLASSLWIFGNHMAQGISHFQISTCKQNAKSSICIKIASYLLGDNAQLLVQLLLQCHSERIRILLLTFILLGVVVKLNPIFMASILFFFNTELCPSHCWYIISLLLFATLLNTESTGHSEP